MLLSRRRFLASLPPALAGLRTTASELPPFPDPEKGISAGWTIAVLPDSQNYAKFAANQKHFDRMCHWIADHLAPWRIQLVLHEGDFVEQNGIAEGGGRGWGDQNSEQQWESARRALAPLADKVPVILATGNHDYGIRNAENRDSRFPEFFPIDWNRPRSGSILLETAPNAAGKHTLENSASAFTAPDGRKILVVSLEWGPRRAVVEWARDLLARQEYASHTGILLTHDFIIPGDLRDGQDGNRRRSGNPHTYGTGRSGDTHDGEDLWKTLVFPSRNLHLVLNGHEMGSHVGRRTDPNAAGIHVHQILFNARGFGGGSDEKGNGGDGWLRLMTWEPDGRTLTVRTFSPLHAAAGRSPWFKGPQWQFHLKLPEAR